MGRPTAMPAGRLRHANVGFCTSATSGGDPGITGQHKGEMHLDWRAEGLACEIALNVTKDS